IFKEPIRAGASNLYSFLGGYDRIESAIYFVHVRETSVGTNSLRNTHPFSREHRGVSYAFAHNGTLKDFHKLPLGQHKPIGETDSEHAFCHLLAVIDEISGKTWTNKNYLKLQTFFQKLNRHGPFNCLFSNGEVLFCYHDDNGYNGMVYRIEKNPTANTIVVASKPLSDESWTPVNRGQLVVLRAGEKIY
ncbi:MAG: class II glutamine amidotransferase, partial [Spirochaetia bacterium]|nr:class II glutamine amidotransferase [Spirochaetia bacterium]